MVRHESVTSHITSLRTEDITDAMSVRDYPVPINLARYDGFGAKII